MSTRLLFLLLILGSLMGRAQTLSLDDLLLIQKSASWQKTDSLLRHRGMWVYDSGRESTQFKQVYEWMQAADTVSDEINATIQLTTLDHGHAPYVLFYSKQESQYQALMKGLTQRKYTPRKKQSEELKRYMLSLTFWLQSDIAVQVAEVRYKKTGNKNRDFLMAVMTRKDYDRGFHIDP